MAEVDCMSTQDDDNVMEVEFDALQLHHQETDENQYNETNGQPAETEVEDHCAQYDEEIHEYYSEEDDRPTAEDYRQYGMYQSLPIPSGPPDMEADCDTAEEYLRRVR